MEALEGIARKAVWAWRERKQEVLLGAAAVGTAAAVVWWLSQPAPKQGVDPAELQATLEAKYDAAVQQGKVIPLATKPHIVVNDGVQFWVATAGVAAIEQKNKNVTSRAKPVDALAHVDPALHVDSVSFHGFDLVLNKFPVVPHHALLVSKTFVQQTSALTVPEWTALWRGVRGLDALGFFNCGTASGASQPRKHMQLLPLSSVRAAASAGGLALAGTPAHSQHPTPPDALPITGIPLDSAIAAGTTPPGAEHGTPLTITAYARAGIPHALAYLGQGVHLQGGRQAGAYLETIFESLAAAAGAITDGSAAYSLLLTRRWMLVVPRCAGRQGAVEVNSLGYAGFLLARGGSAADELSAGPTAALDVLRACAADATA